MKEEKKLNSKPETKKTENSEKIKKLRRNLE
jgi:hypothetical protein